MTRSTPTFCRSGSSTIVSGMVVQLGLAMIPSLSRMSFGFTSGTTSGTFAFMRHAELLSITSAPASAAIGPYISEMSAPAANIAMSTSLNDVSSRCSTFSVLPSYGTSLPTDRSDAKTRTVTIGNCSCARILSISQTTSPVAPTTATFNRLGVGTASVYFVRRLPAVGADPRPDSVLLPAQDAIDHLFEPQSEQLVEAAIETRL